ncbi:MAG: hypothetical protein U0166_29270, partial [Acidobacteriota bacterium]
MTEPLHDRSDILFGRAQDISYLLSRAERTGLTVISGRARSGKSWTLLEVAHLLSASRLVGFARNYGQYPDLLLRAIDDLYQRWLSQASALQQACRLWDTEKGKLLPGLASSLAGIFAGAPGPQQPLATLIKDAIEGAVAASARFSTGAQLPRLDYDLARDFVSACAALGPKNDDGTPKPIALFLDQWDHSPDPAQEASLLLSFLSNAASWPPLHIFLSVRPENLEAAVALQPLLGKTYLPSTLLTLGNMALDQNEAARLLLYCQRTVPATKHLTQEALLDLVDGYPGVVEAWTSVHNSDINSIADLARVAADSHADRFPDIVARLKALDAAQRELITRIVLLPMAADPSLWPELRHLVLGTLPASQLDDLRNAGVLESVDPPSFGHPRRLERALELIITEWPSGTRDHAERFILALAEMVASGSRLHLMPLIALVELSGPAAALGLGPLHRSLCRSAASMLGLYSRADPIAPALSCPAAVAPLLAMGIVNHLPFASAPYGLQLIADLRTLASPRLDDPTLRGAFARGVVNAGRYDPRLGRQAITDTRALRARYPDDDVVAAAFATAVMNNISLLPGPERTGVLDDLRSLAQQRPSPVPILALPLTLVNLLGDADKADSQAHLDELRTFKAAHPDLRGARAALSMGLRNVGITIPPDDALTVAHEMQALRDAYSEAPELETHYLEVLAVAMNAPQESRRSNALSLLHATAAKTSSDVDRNRAVARAFRSAAATAQRGARHSILSDFGSFALRDPHESGVCEQLAMALYDATVQDSSVAPYAIGELARLAGLYPADAAIIEWYAKSFLNESFERSGLEAWGTGEAVLAHVRGLARLQPESSGAAFILAGCLFKMSDLAYDRRDLDKAGEFLDELRAVAVQHATDRSVAAFFGITLGKRIVVVRHTTGAPQAVPLEAELHAIVEAHPGVVPLVADQGVDGFLVSVAGA